MIPKQTPQTQRWLSDDTCGAPFQHKLKSQAVRICHIASGHNYHCSNGTAGIHAWQKLMELLLELMARRMTRSTSNSTHSLILQQSSSALYHLPSYWPWREVNALARPSVLFSLLSEVLALRLSQKACNSPARAHCQWWWERTTHGYEKNCQYHLPHASGTLIFHKGIQFWPKRGLNLH